jgi:hypothetical protein
MGDIFDSWLRERQRKHRDTYAGYVEEQRRKERRAQYAARYARERAKPPPKQSDASKALGCVLMLVLVAIVIGVTLWLAHVGAQETQVTNGLVHLASTR